MLTLLLLLWMMLERCLIKCLNGILCLESWTTVISGYSNCGDVDEDFRVFELMSDKNLAS